MASFRSRIQKRLGAALIVGAADGSSSGDEEHRRGLVLSLCLLASVLMWFSFAMRETYTRTIQVRLEVTNLPEGDALVAVPPTEVRAQIEGEGIHLLRLYYNPPTIQIDASQDAVDLITAGPDVLNNVRLEAIFPRMITLQKDRRISKRVPVRSRVSIITSPGHHVIGQPVVAPDSVTVSGAESIVQGIEYWPTRRLQVKPEGDTVAVRVVLSDSLGSLIEVDQLRASFTASVREFTEAVREIEVIVVNAEAGQAVQLVPPTVRVIYQVALDQFDQAMTATDFYAEVSYPEMWADQSGSVTPTIHYPDGIEFREYRLDPPAHSYFFEVLYD